MRSVTSCYLITWLAVSSLVMRKVQRTLHSICLQNYRQENYLWITFIFYCSFSCGYVYRLRLRLSVTFDIISSFDSCIAIWIVIYFWYLQHVCFFCPCCSGAVVWICIWQFDHIVIIQSYSSPFTRYFVLIFSSVLYSVVYCNFKLFLSSYSQIIVLLTVQGWRELQVLKQCYKTIK